ncbi:glucan biosynthesis protein [Cellvibrio sp.]|uniref:glucan biosynthesis protein n=1 Tax=Cellvibrio sp. TaxID=1965322 RepID=UPI0039647E8F
MIRLPHALPGSKNSKPFTKSILRVSSLLSTLLALSVATPFSIAATPNQPTTGAEISQPGLFDAISSRAKLLAKENYKPVVANIPEALAKMDYDQYRSIRFRPEASLWRNEALFEVQLFHAGYISREPKILHMATNNGDSILQFKQEYFNYEGPAASLAGIAPKDIGFAAFRLHYPLNNVNYKDEFFAFSGASYFRMIGPNQAYGISGRGLAIDTAESSGEEFPSFREFWLLKPTPTENHVVIYALLDSPSIAGAYRFDMYPGAKNQVKVTARLYARKDIKKLGVAPLTSMFLFGENSVNKYKFDDFRNEVHNSDGLLMQTSSSEWIWRPLTNHRALHVSSLSDNNPQGFGMLQRDRNFENYLDTEAKYEKRPSIWVKPDIPFGKGRVELVEIPSDSEANDNMVAYWVPEQSMKAGEEREYKYTLFTYDAEIPDQPLAKVLRTKTGWGAVAAQSNPPPKSKRQFAIDFQGGELDKLPAGTIVQADLMKNAGKLSDLQVSRLPNGKSYRVSFKIEPEGNNVVDMRLFLKTKDKRLSEVWSYPWYPDNTPN